MYADRNDKYKDDHRYSAANIIGVHPRDWNFLKSATSLFNKDGFIVPSKWGKSVNITNGCKLSHVRIVINTSHRKNRGTFCLNFSDNTYEKQMLSFDDGFRAFLEEKSNADFLTLEFPSTLLNSSNSSNSNSNNSNSSNDNDLISKQSALKLSFQDPSITNHFKLDSR